MLRHESGEYGTVNFGVSAEYYWFPVDVHPVRIDNCCNSLGPSRLCEHSFHILAAGVICVQHPVLHSLDIYHDETLLELLNQCRIHMNEKKLVLPEKVCRLQHTSYTIRRHCGRLATFCLLVPLRPLLCFFVSSVLKYEKPLILTAMSTESYLVCDLSSDP